MRSSAPLVLFCALTLTACDGRAQVATSRGASPALLELPALADSAWGALVLSLSEEGGYFDTDNLISNERSYLHVLAPLRRLEGGAYVGVEPDQSFSYLAATRAPLSRSLSTFAGTTCFNTSFSDPCSLFRRTAPNTSHACTGARAT